MSEFRTIAMKTEFLRTHDGTHFLKAKSFYNFLYTKHTLGLSLTLDIEIGSQVSSCIPGVAFLT